MCENVYEQTIKMLMRAGVQSPRLEARLLIAHMLHIEPDEVCGQTDVSADVLVKLKQNIQKRVEGMPLDKILGHKEFYKYDFIVSEDVLSPRPDTEILLESAINLITENNLKNVLELGIGSGCLLLSLLKEIPNIQGVGIDISSKALNIAKQNAHLLHVADRCRLECQDWFDDNIEHTLGQKFDLIISNPPYIKTNDILSLDIGVQKYDPLLALDGGTDGLRHYKRIAFLIPKLLRKGGYVALEVGLGQSSDVQQIFETAGLKYKKTIHDLADIDRTLIFEL